MVDLSGLPEVDVHLVRQSVQGLRDKHAEEAAPAVAELRSPNQADPEQWSAEFRGWVASHPKRDLTMDDSRESIYDEHA